MYFDQDNHKNYPMLNLLLIGPSGIGKSTSVHMGFDVIRGLPKSDAPQIVKGAPTPQKLHVDLYSNPHAILFASELANFFTQEKFMVGLIPYITELLDYNPIEKRTLSGDIITIDEPACTIMGGSTQEWLQDMIPDTAVGGGFLPRFLIVTEEHKGQKVAFPKAALSEKQYEKLLRDREIAFGEFRDLTSVHFGEIKMADMEAADTYSEFYNVYQPESGHLQPFAARAGEFVTRLSMLLAISCGKNVIEAEHVASAIQLYKYCAAKLQQVVIPFTKNGKQLMQVQQAIGKDPMPMKTLYHLMKNSLTAGEVDQCVASLIQSGDIKRDKEGNVYK